MPVRPNLVLTLFIFEVSRYLQLFQKQRLNFHIVILLHMCMVEKSYAEPSQTTIQYISTVFFRQAFRSHEAQIRLD